MNNVDLDGWRGRSHRKRRSDSHRSTRALHRRNMEYRQARPEEGAPLLSKRADLCLSVKRIVRIRARRKRVRLGTKEAYEGEERYFFKGVLLKKVDENLEAFWRE